jgi:hypothetical protein
MEITLLARNRRFKKKVERDHYWYDPIDKMMYHGVGGNMEFNYNPKFGRSFPKLVDHEEWVLDNDFSELKKWAESQEVEIVSMADGYNIVIDVKTNVDSVLDSLTRKDIMFEYDIREHKNATSKNRSR